MSPSLLNHQIRAIINENVINPNLTVWCGNIKTNFSFIKEIKEFLSSEELKNIENYYFLEDKCNYTITHGVLRYLLSQYNNQYPKEIDYYYNYYGKPFLKQKFKEDPLFFNISHSGNRFCIAIDRQNEVGIDIQVQDKSLDLDLILSDVCTKKEIEYLLSLGNNERRKRFNELWVRKEAVVKALGKGLSHPINEIEVLNYKCFKSLTNLNLERWKLEPIVVNHNYTAVVCFQ